MPLCRNKRGVRPEKPPNYSPSATPSLTTAAIKSLLTALSRFRKHSRYERNPINDTWQVAPGALVTIIKLNLGILNKSLADRAMLASRVDWYSEMVVEHGIPYNNPKLIRVLFSVDM